jgi:hypothetical protein
MSWKHHGHAAGLEGAAHERCHFLDRAGSIDDNPPLAIFGGHRREPVGNASVEVVAGSFESVELSVLHAQRDDGLWHVDEQHQIGPSA